jgi:predicted N-acetyltransferase YhbS
MKLTIRPEKPEDISSIYALNKSAFGQDNEARLVDALRKSDVFISEQEKS